MYTRNAANKKIKARLYGRVRLHGRGVYIGIGEFYCCISLLNLKPMDHVLEKMILTEGGRVDQFIFIGIKTIDIVNEPNVFKKIGEIVMFQLLQ
jgi:hypothetical protein